MLESKSEDKALYEGSVKDVEDNLLESVNPLEALARKRKHGPKVFICCCSSISRSPTLVLAYLTLFKKVSCWNNLDMTNTLLRKFHPISTPNLQVIQKLLKDKSLFQDMQIDETQNALLK